MIGGLVCVRGQAKAARRAPQPCEPGRVEERLRERAPSTCSSWYTVPSRVTSNMVGGKAPGMAAEAKQRIILILRRAVPPRRLRSLRRSPGDRRWAGSPRHPGAGGHAERPCVERIAGASRHVHPSASAPQLDGEVDIHSSIWCDRAVIPSPCSPEEWKCVTERSTSLATACLTFRSPPFSQARAIAPLTARERSSQSPSTGSGAQPASR